MLLNCCAREDSRVPQTARRLNQLILKEINLNFHWKDWYLGWSFNTLATWCKELTHWKTPWCWERLRLGWDGWMASPTEWRWVCSNSSPFSRWCHPTISSSVTCFSCPQPSPASGSFPTSSLFALGGQNIRALALATGLYQQFQWILMVDFL